MRIAINQDEPLGIYGAESNLKHFTAEIVTNSPGREYNLVIKTVPPLPSGNTQGQITFKTTATNTPTMSLPALAIVQPSLVVSPAQITLPAQPSTQPQTYVVAIRNHSSAPFSVSNASSNVGSIAVALKEVEAGRQFNLELTIPAGYDIPEGQRIEITANSTHPAYPLIKAGKLTEIEDSAFLTLDEILWAPADLKERVARRRAWRSASVAPGR